MTTVPQQAQRAAQNSDQMDGALQSYAAQLSDPVARQQATELAAQLTALKQQRQEHASDLQEASHQLLAMHQSAQPDFQRGAGLTFHAQWLEAQIAQIDVDLDQARGALRTTIARATIARARQQMREHNALATEGARAVKALIEQAEALHRTYQERLQPLRNEIAAVENVGKALGVLLPINPWPVQQTGLYPIDG